MKLISGLVRRACVALAKRLPCRVITRDGTTGSDVYLERYYLFGRPPPYPESWSPPVKVRLPFLPLVYLHRFARSDFDLELHNHPFAGTAFILAGGYEEERRFAVGVSQWGWWAKSDELRGNIDTGFWVRSRTFKPGSINKIAPDTFHRVDLLEADAWTLFMIGPRVADWGFWDRWTGVFQGWKTHLSARAAVAN